MWVLYQYHSIIIYQGISEPSHGKEVVDGINASENYFIYQLMYNGQLPGSKQFDSQILMYSCTPKNEVSLAKEFQKHLSKDHRKYVVTNQGK